MVSGDVPPHHHPPAPQHVLVVGQIEHSPLQSGDVRLQRNVSVLLQLNQTCNHCLDGERVSMLLLPPGPGDEQLYDGYFILVVEIYHTELRGHEGGHQSKA